MRTRLLLKFPKPRLPEKIARGPASASVYRMRFSVEGNLEEHPASQLFVMCINITSFSYKPIGETSNRDVLVFIRTRRRQWPISQWLIISININLVLYTPFGKSVNGNFPMFGRKGKRQRCGDYFYRSNGHERR